MKGSRLQSATGIQKYIKITETITNYQEVSNREGSHKFIFSLELGQEYLFNKQACLGTHLHVQAVYTIHIAEED